MQEYEQTEGSSPGCWIKHQNQHHISLCAGVEVRMDEALGREESGHGESTQVFSSISRASRSQDASPL